MMQKEDKWLKAIHDKMADYSEPVPHNGWESLEKELKEVPLNQRKIVPYLRMGVAAVILLVFISSVAIFLLYSPADEYMKHISESGNLDTPSVETIKNDILTETQEEKTEIINQLVYVNKKEKNTKEKSNQKKVAQILSEKDNNETQKITDTIFVTEHKKNEIDISSKEQPRPKNKPKKTSFPQTGYLAEASKTKKEPKWSMKLSAGNPLVNVNASGSGFDAFSESNKASYSKEHFYSNISNDLEETSIQLSDNRKEILMNTMKEEAEVKTETDYKLPISFGLSARYELTDKFAIETGIMYTKLSSELRSGSNDNYYLEEDDLHYLGIPLKGSWTFLDKKQFSLYVSAGGAFEKSISGKRRTQEFINGEKKDEVENNLDTSKPQWSLSGAVGVQYNVTNHLGIYVEPGIVHYFDDGSGINTIRKKKPTNFNLQIGLRLSY